MRIVPVSSMNYYSNFQSQNATTFEGKHHQTLKQFHNIHKKVKQVVDTFCECKPEESSLKNVPIAESRVRTENPHSRSWLSFGEQVPLLENAETATPHEVIRASIERASKDSGIYIPDTKI